MKKAILLGTTSIAVAFAMLAIGFVVVALVQPNVMAAWTAWTPMATPLAGVSLAFPWQLTVGFAAALLVCLVGAPKTPAP